MKIKYLFHGLALVGTCALASNVEIPVRGVYAPTHGYDDNDTIGLVVDGFLPNLCYSQRASLLEIDESQKMITIRQEAHRRRDADCAPDDDSLHEAMRQSTPFTAEVIVGQLKRATYRVQFVTPTGPSTRELDVSTASTSTVDSKHYAHITNVFTAAKVPASTRHIELRLTGYLSTPCVALESVQVSLENNVFTVLPILTTVRTLCPQVEVPFTKTVRLRTPQVGRYLVHSRSIGGNARNMFFDVVE